MRCPICCQECPCSCCTGPVKFEGTKNNVLKWSGDNKLIFRKNCCNAVSLPNNNKENIDPTILPWSGSNDFTNEHCRTKSCKRIVRESIPIDTLFSTAVDDSNIVLFSGFDPHYQVTISNIPSTPLLPSIISTHPWVFLNPSDRAGFIAVNSPLGFNSSLQYKTSFDTTGFDLSTIRIKFTIMVDGYLTDVLINGTSSQFSTPGGPYDTVFYTDYRGFVEGLNTIYFMVTNSSSSCGIRVVIDAFAVPYNDFL